MKLVFINRYFYPDHSATSQILSQLAFDLSRDHWEVHVISSRQLYDDPSARLPRTETVNGVTVHRVWTSKFGRGRLLGRGFDYVSFYFSAAARLISLIGRADVVIIKTDPPMLSVFAVPIARIRHARSVNWLQDVFPEVASALRVPGFRGALARFLAGARDRSLRAADVNVVLSEGMRRRIEERGIPAERAVVIPNWADGSEIWPVAAEFNSLRVEWGFTDRDFVVGYSGNMGRVHEFETVLKAGELLRSEADVRYLFVGAGKQTAWLRNEAKSLGLSEHFQFRNYQPRERLAASLSVPDVHLVTLRRNMEGLIVPSKLYGIMAAGRAAIFVGDPEGEVARVLAEANSGISVQAGDAQGLANAITTLRRNPQRRAIMGENARRTFEAQYSRVRAYEKWQDLLAGLDRA